MELLLLTTLIYLVSSAGAADHYNGAVLPSLVVQTRDDTVSERSRNRRAYSAKDSLYCPPCEQLHCYKQRKSHLNCKGGYTVGVCGCCRTCAKVENEQCGGEHNYLGRCDRGLTCESQLPTEVTFVRDGEKTVYSVVKGICRKGNLFTT